MSRKLVALFQGSSEKFRKAHVGIKIVIIITIAVLLWLSKSLIFPVRSNNTQIQSTDITKGTIVAAVTGSGLISSINNASINTQASGVVKNIYVKDGQNVSVGDPIAEIELDRYAQQKYTQASSSYQSAKNTLDSAKTQLFTLQANMFTKWDKFKNLAENDTYKDTASANRNLVEFLIPQDEWLAAEAQYKNQQNVVLQTQTALTSAWLSLQQYSPVIYAPISGKVTGLSLQVGSVILASTANSESATTTSQKVASITTLANPLVSLNLTEIDAPKIKVGQKATITLDAYPGKTFTGKVISIDLVGSVSSGVTTYPTVIQFDTSNPEILPNMSASASIITQTKDNVLIAPSSAIENQDGQSTIKVLKNGQTVEIDVETGISSDTQVEIISGLSEGDRIVTGINALPTGTASGQSPFSPIGNRSFGGGGGQVRVIKQ